MDTYICQHISSVLPVPELLNHKIWKSAQSVCLKDVVTGNSPAQATEARLMWSDDCLFIRFIAEDKEVYATMSEFNNPLYEEDVVEAFIDDDSDLSTYQEFNLNPLNAVLHYMIYRQQDKNISFARVQQTVESAVHVNTETAVWSSVIAIPFNEFVHAPHCPPEPGDIWKFNLFRINRGSVSSHDEYQALSPTGEIAFHRPEFFVNLKFEKSGTSFT